MQSVIWKKKLPPLGCRSEEAAAALFGFLDVSALTAARTTCQGQNAAISVT